MKDLFKSIAMVIVLLIFAANSYSQAVTLEKQVAAPLPKLALLGAESYVRGGKKYHKVILTVTNRALYSSAMFDVAGLPVLPPGPCVNGNARIFATVYGDTGQSLTKCMYFTSPGSMQSFSFLIENGKAIPKFVYLVLTDRKTGGAYRSNSVSPWTGQTK